MRRYWKESSQRSLSIGALIIRTRGASRAGSVKMRPPVEDRAPAVSQYGGAPSATPLDASDGSSGLVANFEALRDNIPKSIANDMKTAFWDAPTKSCMLCGDAPGVPSHVHYNHHPHNARMGIVERALSGAAGVLPLDLSKRTWENLHQNGSVTTFDRLPSLSAATTAERQHRMHFLLQFLVDRGVLRHSLSLSHTHGFMSRAYHFETFEMVGDNAIKYILNDRLLTMFPTSQGGLSGGLFQVQQLLDSNEGLRNVYEHLNLGCIVRCHLPNSKVKSDVVESLFGELQCKIWAAEQRWDVVSYHSEMAAELRYLIALLKHVLNELGHMLLQWAVEQTLERAGPFVEANMVLLPHVQRWLLQKKAMSVASRLAMRPAIVAQRKQNPEVRPMESYQDDAAARNRLMAVAATPWSCGGVGTHSPPLGATLALRCVRSTQKYWEAVAASVQCLKMSQDRSGSGTATRRQQAARGGPTLTRRLLLRELRQSHGDVFVSVDAGALLEQAVAAHSGIHGPQSSSEVQPALHPTKLPRSRAVPQRLAPQLIRSMCEDVMVTSGFTSI